MEKPSNLETHPATMTYQNMVGSWLIACFGEEIARNGMERNHRFLEEALELVQALGCTASEAHQLVDYVFGRPIGDVHQEMGGVMVTLAALAWAHGIPMLADGNIELERVWLNIERIRAKQAAKPKHSPLPETPASSKSRDEEENEADVGRLVIRAANQLSFAGPGVVATVRVAVDGQWFAVSVKIAEARS